MRRMHGRISGLSCGELRYSDQKNPVITQPAGQEDQQPEPGMAHQPLIERWLKIQPAQREKEAAQYKADQSRYAGGEATPAHQHVGCGYRMRDEDTRSAEKAHSDQKDAP